MKLNEIKEIFKFPLNLFNLILFFVESLKTLADKIIKKQNKLGGDRCV